MAAKYYIAVMPFTKRFWYPSQKIINTAKDTESAKVSRHILVIDADACFMFYCNTLFKKSYL